MMYRTDHHFRCCTAFEFRCKSDIPNPIREIENTITSIDATEETHAAGACVANAADTSSLISPSPNGMAEYNCSISLIPVKERHPPKRDKPPTTMQTAPIVVGHVAVCCVLSIKTV